MNVTVSNPCPPPPPRVFTITLTEPEVEALMRLLNTSEKLVSNSSGYSRLDELCIGPLWRLLKEAI